MSFREVPQFSLVSGVFLCLFFVGFCLFYFFVIATKVTSKKSFPSKLSSLTWMQWAASYWLPGRTPLLPCRFGARFKRVEVLRRSVSTSWNLCMTTRLTAQVHHWCKAPMSFFFFLWQPLCFPFASHLPAVHICSSFCAERLERTVHPFSVRIQDANAPPKTTHV